MSRCCAACLSYFLVWKCSDYRPNSQVVIYTGDDCDAETLAARAANTFGTPPLRPISVVCARQPTLMLSASDMRIDLPMRALTVRCRFGSSPGASFLRKCAQTHPKTPVPAQFVQFPPCGRKCARCSPRCVPCRCWVSLAATRMTGARPADDVQVPRSDAAGPGPRLRGSFRRGSPPLHPRYVHRHGGAQP